MGTDEEMLSFVMEQGLFIVQADSKKLVALNGLDITADIETEPSVPEKKNGIIAP